MQARPNFFIVGAPKCGTTAFSEYLSDHPDICFSRSKEPHFFNTDFDAFRWARSLDEYLDHFADYKGEKIIAEASVQYLYSMDAARNIMEFCPEARILVMLRKPSTFLRSYHNQLLMNFDETIENLRTAWDMSGQRPQDSMPAENREPAFLDYKRVGLFSEQLARYLDVFDRSQVMVVFMEDWINDPRALYIHLMLFLGIEDDGKTDFPQVHAAKHVSSRALHRITQRPPRVLKAVVDMIKRIPGMEKFKFSDILRRMNVRSGYNEIIVDKALAAEIEAYFAEDQVRLKQMLDQLP